MGMMDCSRRLPPSFQRHRGNAVWFIHSAMGQSAIPKREQQEVATELAGIWKQENRESALLNLAAFKAKYQKRYPEAMRSLCEDEEHLLTFYAFRKAHASLHSQYQCH
jgi:transposase-like protein